MRWHASAVVLWTGRSGQSQQHSGSMWVYPANIIAFCSTPFLIFQVHHKMFRFHYLCFLLVSLPVVFHPFSIFVPKWNECNKNLAETMLESDAVSTEVFQVLSNDPDGWERHGAIWYARNQQMFSSASPWCRVRRASAKYGLAFPLGAWGIVLVAHTYMPAMPFKMCCVICRHFLMSFNSVRSIRHISPNSPCNSCSICDFGCFFFFFLKCVFCAWGKHICVCLPFFFLADWVNMFFHPSSDQRKAQRSAVTKKYLWYFFAS